MSGAKILSFFVRKSNLLLFSFLNVYFCLVFVLLSLMYFYFLWFHSISLSVIGFLIFFLPSFLSLFFYFCYFSFLSFKFGFLLSVIYLCSFLFPFSLSLSFCFCFCHRKKLQFPISPFSSKPLSYKEKEELRGRKMSGRQKQRKLINREKLSRERRKQRNTKKNEKKF